MSSRRAPWIILGSILAVEALILILQPVIRQDWSRSNLIWVGALLLFVVIFVYLILNRVLELYHQREKLHQRILEADRLVLQGYQRLDAIFQVGQKFIEATNEDEVIELVLKLSVDLAGAKGASFVPFDDHSQPMAVSSYGEIPHPIADPWLEYLSSPTMRARCKTCDQHERLTASCPLLMGPLTEAAEVFCIPLQYKNQEFGILNIYMSGTSQLDSQTQAFLGAMIDETALALDGVRLRRRELIALRHMESFRQKTGIQALLNGLLESLYQSLDADSAILLVRHKPSSPDFSRYVIGELSTELQLFIDGVMRGVIESGKPVILGDFEGETDGKTAMKSFMAAPLIMAEHLVIGSILLGNRRSGRFNQRQLALLQTMAGQLSLVIQNSSLVTELEFQAMMEERKRLAREIHDGLAQTLGFLKLQAAQMKNYLARGEYERTSAALDQYYVTLSEAYQDARQSIDGLRIGLSEDGLQGWLNEIATEFEEVSGNPVHLRNVSANTQLPPEVHAQLIRVVQEALSNVRKHAQPSQVWIDCFEKDGDLWLEIQDDGIGFSPEDVSGSARHGLRGMRERVELIGAEFQVISRAGEGTIVRIRLPLQSIPLPEISG